jgi:hypothetical protein
MLENYAQGQALEEISFWKQTTESNFNFPVDFNSGDDSMSNSSTLVECLSENETQQLLHEANKAYGTRSDELMIIALVLALSEIAKNSEERQAGLPVFFQWL